MSDIEPLKQMRALRAALTDRHCAERDDGRLCWCHDVGCLHVPGPSLTRARAHCDPINELLEQTAWVEAEDVKL
jgi:hypothetical protein